MSLISNWDTFFVLMVRPFLCMVWLSLFKSRMIRKKRAFPINSWNLSVFSRKEISLLKLYITRVLQFFLFQWQWLAVWDLNSTSTNIRIVKKILSKFVVRHIQNKVNQYNFVWEKSRNIIFSKNFSIPPVVSKYRKFTTFMTWVISCLLFKSCTVFKLSP